jgi:hypothetical protein
MKKTYIPAESKRQRKDKKIDFEWGLEIIWSTDRAII